MRVRLAELIAMISLGTDLGMGQPMEHVMRQSLIALRLADRLGLDDESRAVVYYVGLIAWVGCHVDAYEQAKWFGDDQALKNEARHVDMTEVAARAFILSHVGAGQGLMKRARVGIEFVGDGRRAAREMIANHWAATNELAARLGLDDKVRESLYQTFERWDGNGVPAEAKGEEILLPARLVSLADVVEVYHRSGGVEAAIAVARERSGSQFDPALVDVFCEDAPLLFSDIDSLTTWPAVIDAEPALEIVLSEDELDSALEAIADFADLKSPWTIGHSRGVADLACAATKAYGLSDDYAKLVRRAGLVHDLGRLGVSNAIWDKRGPLSAAELERVRLHPYLTERMLAVIGCAGPGGGDRGPAPRAPRRLGISPWTVRRRAHPAGADSRGGRRLSRDDRAAAPSRGARCPGDRRGTPLGRPPGAVRRRGRRSCAERGRPSRKAPA
jgi:HD domain